MKKENKELLIKDICAKLPYGVKMNHISDDKHSPKTLIGVAKDMITLEGLGGYECVDIEDYKPYLFPLSSMTEEQSKEFALLQVNMDKSEYLFACDCINLIDWLNKNHFDYNGLIEKGLAIDCTNLNIY